MTGKRTGAPLLAVQQAGLKPDWLRLFSEAAPDLDIVGENDPRAGGAAYVTAWKPPADWFRRFTGLQGVFNLGAGVDALLGRADLSPEIPVLRLTDAGMAQQMAEYALAGVLRFHRDLDRYEQQQRDRQWRPLPPVATSDFRVSVLGLGAIGGHVARAIAALGYPVTGWSRSPRVIDGVWTVSGADALDPLLAGTDALVMVLPSTPETRGLLDARRLALLPAGAAIINCGRGDQIDMTALVAGLDSGALRGAMLDVLPVEPLPAGDPLWLHPKVVLTPHVAAETLPEPSVEQIVTRLRLLLAGKPVEGVVTRDRAY